MDLKIRIDDDTMERLNDHRVREAEHERDQALALLEQLMGLYDCLAELRAMEEKYHLVLAQVARYFETLAYQREGESNGLWEEVLKLRESELAKECGLPIKDTGYAQADWHLAYQKQIDKFLDVR